jgi:DNA-directed RNA polymerase beta' subunit
LKRKYPFFHRITEDARTAARPNQLIATKETPQDKEAESSQLRTNQDNNHIGRKNESGILTSDPRTSKSVSLKAKASEALRSFAKVL